MKHLPVVVRAAVAAIVVLAAQPDYTHAQQNQEDVVALLEANAYSTQKVMVPMRDGARMAADVYRPRTDEPVPIIFSRTPYNFASWRDGEFSSGTYRRAMSSKPRVGARIGSKSISTPTSGPCVCVGPE